jgi:hypothetical protein
MDIIRGKASIPSDGKLVDYDDDQEKSNQEHTLSQQSKSF